MDILIRGGASPRISLVTTRGITINQGEGWRYVFTNPTLPLPPIVLPFEEWYFGRAFFFSRWDDSVAFVALNAGGFEAGTVGYSAHYVSPNWWELSGFTGCWIGYSPQATFVFPRAHVGVVYCWLCGFNKSPDNGATWVSLTYWLNYPGYFLTVNDRCDSLIYAGGGVLSSDTVGLYYTADEGASWHRLYTFTEKPESASLVALGDTLVLGTTRPQWDSATVSAILRSTDHGLTWSTALDSVEVEAITSREDGQLFAAGNDRIFASHTAGETWRVLSSLPFPAKVTGLFADPRGDTLYVATLDSGLYRLHGFTTSVDRAVPITSGYELSQNYPNPFNATTIITYRLARSTRVRLRVFDIFGRTVRNFPDEYRSSGTYAVSFDSGSLSSGVYFYQLKADDFVAVKKMTVLK